MAAKLSYYAKELIGGLDFDCERAIPWPAANGRARNGIGRSRNTGAAPAGLQYQRHYYRQHHNYQDKCPRRLAQRFLQRWGDQRVEQPSIMRFP